MLFFDPDNLQFTVMRSEDEGKPIVLVKIFGFTDENEANLFSNQLLALHGETETKTIH
jgi:hypothetical protein